MSPAHSDDQHPRSPGDGDRDGAGQPAAVPPPYPYPERPALAQPATPRRWRPEEVLDRRQPASGNLGRAATVTIAAVLVTALLGLPLGLLWAAVAPDIPVRRTQEGAALTQSQPEQFIAADGWFTLLGLGFGVLAAIAVWLILRRHRGPLGMIVVVVGTIGAAVLAWRVGRGIGLAEYERLLASASVGEILNKPPDLRAGGFEWIYGVIPVVQGNLLLPAFGAAVVYTLLAGWSRHPTLRPDAVEAGVGSAPPAMVSWDSWAPPVPPAAPAPPESDAAERPHG